MLKKGVYTAKCPTCSRSILIHVLSNGSISPNKCSACEAEFGELKKGEERNTFAIVPKAKQSKIVVNQEAEEKPKEKKLTVKTRKESFKVWRDS